MLRPNAFKKESFFFEAQNSVKSFRHRGEAALRINCDPLDTFRTKGCKEIIETIKIYNIQQKCKISENFAIFKIYRLCRIIKNKLNHENTTSSCQINTLS